MSVELRKAALALAGLAGRAASRVVGNCIEDKGSRPGCRTCRDLQAATKAAVQAVHDALRETESTQPAGLAGERCSRCGHPKADHAIAGVPGPCAWTVCACKVFQEADSG